MADTIKQRIALDGDSDVKKSLAEIGDVGEKSFKKIDDASKQTSASLGALANQRLANLGISPEEFQKRGEAFKNGGGGDAPPSLRPPGRPPEGRGRGGADGITELRESLYSLRPALVEAGIGFGQIRSIMLAARGGVEALVASVAIGLVTALDKAGDAANDAAARLGAFKGSSEQGRQSFHELQDTAGELRVPATELAAPFEQLLRANQSSPAGTQASDKTLQDTLATFVKGAQADRTNPDKAIAGITEFFGSLKETGTLTPEATGKLLEVAPTLTKQILDDLSKRLPGKEIKTTQDVIQSTANVAPQVNANLLKSRADAVESISTAWVAFKASVEHLEETVGSTGAIAGALNTGAANLKSIADAIANIIFIARNLKIPTEADLHPHKPTPEQIAALPDVGSPPIPLSGETYRPATGLPVQPDIPAGSSFQRPEFRSHEATGTEAAAADTAKKVEVLGDASEKAAKQVEGHGNASENPEDAAKRFAANANKLQIIGTELSKRQAEIDLKFQPQEAASLLAKDQISVQNADIHLAQAKISGLEAQKNKELSALAPEEARQNVADAAANRDRALSTYLRNRGVDTSGLDAQIASGEDSRALARAQTALNRATLEAKYAYLEPQKAELNAQQTDTAIKSAEIEKRDTSLKRAKDAEGAPLSHELSQLRYAQASLDELKLTNKYGQATVDKLDEILKALTKKADQGGNANKDHASNETGKVSDGANKIADTGPRSAGDQVQPGNNLLDKNAAADSAKSAPSFDAASDKKFGTNNVAEIQGSPPQDQINAVLEKHKADLTVQEAPLDASKVQEAIDKFRAFNGELGKFAQIDPASAGILSSLSDRSDGSVKGQRAQTQGELDRMVQNQQQITEFEQSQQKGFSESIRRQGGIPSQHAPSIDDITHGHYDQNYNFVSDDKIVTPAGQDFGFPRSGRPGSQATPQPLNFPDYKQFLQDSVFPQGNVPLPQPRPSEAPQPEPQSSLEQPQQFADLSGAISKIVDAISAAANQATDKAKLDQGGQPVSGAGIRGDAQPAQDNAQPPPDDAPKLAELGDDASSAGGALKSLGDAATQAAGNLQNIANSTSPGGSANSSASGANGSEQVHAATGGHIIRAATGGRIDATDGGQLRGPGTGTSDDIPIWGSNNEFMISEKGVKATGLPALHAINEGKLKLADGGLVDRFRGRVAAMGMSTIDVPHLAIGGMPEIASANLGETELGPSGASQMEHWGTIDLRSDHADFKVATQRDTMRDLAASAQKAKRFSTGPKPFWYGGTGR